MPISGESFVYSENGVSKQIGIISFFDLNKTFISRLTYVSKGSIPAEAKYYRVSMNGGFGINPQLEIGDTITSYVLPQVLKNVDTERKVNVSRVATFYIDDYIPLGTDTFSVDCSEWAQRCFDDAKTSAQRSIIFFGQKRYTIKNTIVLSSSNDIIVDGNGAAIYRDITEENGTPLFLKSTLENEDGTERVYQNTQTTIRNFEFIGGNANVCILLAFCFANIEIYNCKFRRFDKAILLKSCNGVSIHNCRFDTIRRGVSCERIEESYYGVNYTTEGWGWNDGINIYDCSFASAKDNVQLIYYGGSNNEGVITIKNCIFGLSNTSTNENNTAIQLFRFKVAVIDSCWCEIFNSAGAVFLEASYYIAYSHLLTISNNHLNNNQYFSDAIKIDRVYQCEIFNNDFSCGVSNYVINATGYISVDNTEQIINKITNVEYDEEHQVAILTFENEPSYVAQRFILHYHGVKYRADGREGGITVMSDYDYTPLVDGSVFYVGTKCLLHKEYNETNNNPSNISVFNNVLAFGIAKAEKLFYAPSSMHRNLYGNKAFS